MRIPRITPDWLFIGGLILPSAYVALSQGVYFALGYRVIVSLSSGGASTIIFFAGVAKALLYSVQLLTREKNPKRSEMFSSAFFTIHMGVAILVAALFISALFTRFVPLEYALKASFTVLITEATLFPCMALLHLQDVFRHRRDDLVTVLLLSVTIYLCVAFLATSNLLETRHAFANVPGLTPLEDAGLRLDYLLFSVAAFVATPLFWHSASLYSFDIAPPPDWVNGLYVLTLALLLYFQAHSTSGSKPVRDSIDGGEPISVDKVRIASTTLMASVLTFLIVLGADSLLPHDVTGKAFQLFVFLIPLLAVFIMTTRRTQ